MQLTQRAQNRQRPLAAGFSIAAGSLIIFSSILVWQMIVSGSPDDASTSWFGGVEDGGITSVVTESALIPLIGLVCGSIVLLAGVMMYARPQYKRIWGVMALIFSVLSILALGGFLLVGTGLGVIGGILAVANRQV